MKYIKKNRILISLFRYGLFGVFICTTPLFSATITLTRTLKWSQISPYTLENKSFTNYQTFQGASHRAGKNYLPLYQEIIPLQEELIEGVFINSQNIETLSPSQTQSATFLTSDFQLKYKLAYQNGKPFVIVEFIPMLVRNGVIEKLITFSIEIKTSPIAKTQSAISKKAFASHSVLANGDWYKLATLNNGMYRIDYANLKNMGLDPDIIDPRKIQLFGHGAGMLPQQNSANRIDDLAEISILVQGEEDGKFNPGDFIAFYGESQLNQWRYNPATSSFAHVSNLYCDTTYYFLTVGSANGKRIEKAALVSNPTVTIDNYQHLYFYENDRANLIKSGKVWVGEEFDRVTQQSFNVSIPNLITSAPINFLSSVTAHSFIESKFTASVNGSVLLTQSCSAITPGYEYPFTNGLVMNNTNFNSSSSNFTIDYSYNKPASGSIGWLDFFEIKARAELRNYNGNFIFRDAVNLGSGIRTRFNIASNRTLTVLDVTNPVSPFIMEGDFQNNIYGFTTTSDSLKTFAAYDGTNYLQVNFAGKIANQNLHALPYADGFIITHPNFYTEANRLAEHHRKKDLLKIHVINIQDIYNEFSSGAQDLCAVRDFLRMFYKRANGDPSLMPKYVLLFGRASYDYKYRRSPNSNFIPTFESNESFGPTTSYCSDDFIGFLDDSEGNWDIGGNPNELLDIGIGRLIVTNNEEANNMVDKMIAYTSKDALANWRYNLVFTADDGDQNLHQNQSNSLANSIQNKYPEYNVEKIFLDAYKKESTAGGSRFPDAQKAFNNSIEKGCLVWNYVGHGGEVGLTAERVLGIDDVNSWTNGLKSTGAIRLPLFMTATCEFSRFDDPARFSAGELVLLNPNGGGIGLFTTVRLVYSGQNEVLNSKLYDNIGFDSASQVNPPKMGDIIKNTKNAYLDVNTRNFTFLGDPFLTLAYPNYKIKTSMINGVSTGIFKDTLKALNKVEVSGVVTFKNGTVDNNFNGIIYPTVYDKTATYSTLGNTPPESTPMEFKMQNNVLYRGKASVTNGLFTFTFIVPKDIAYEFGKGKISYYGENQNTDAGGFENTILIGGTSDSIKTDNAGPLLKLYMNDEKFVNGGLTNENPVFIAKLFDENGINTTGRGIGRDLTGVLNNDNTKSVVMNDYYQAYINSYQSGEVIYKYKNLPVGKHLLKFKAYDVYNNVSEATLEFEVKKAENTQISHLLNYPNPFNNFTTFHFDHNQCCENLSVMIQIFTVSGKLVKTLQTEVLANGTHFDQLNWDGLDDYGDKLAKGVYIYKLKLKSPGNKVAEKIEKLVILN